MSYLGQNGSAVVRQPSLRRRDDLALPVDILERRNGVWTGRSDSVEALLKIKDLPEVLIVFAPLDPEEENAQALRDRPRAKDELSDKFGIPKSFWFDIALKASGFFGYQDHEPSDETQWQSSFFRFLVKEAKEKTPRPAQSGQIPAFTYKWDKLGFFTNWTNSGKAVAFCFDMPIDLRNSVVWSFESTGSEMAINNPFVLHPILVEASVAFFDEKLWLCRDLVRGIEKNRNKTSEPPNPDYVGMHEIARHVLHSSETLEIAIETVLNMIRRHEGYADENLPADKNPSPNTNLPTDTVETKTFRRIRHSLQYQTTLLKCLHLRARALDDRLRNEINLAFNVVSQYDSRIQVRIGAATQADSTAMKMISFLGFLFLPGTFISAIYSMSFFNFTPPVVGEPGKGRWSVSKDFWIYWATTLPLTSVVMILWFAWLRSPYARNPFMT